MSHADTSRESKTLRWATCMLLGVAILESGGFILGFSLMAPPLIILIPTIFALSVWLFRWLCFCGIPATWALLCTALAVMVWPWTTVMLIGWFGTLLAGPKGIDLAWLFGPLVPYAVIAVGGLVQRGKKPGRRGDAVKL